MKGLSGCSNLSTPTQYSTANQRHTHLSTLQKQASGACELQCLPRPWKQDHRVPIRQASAKCWPLAKWTKEWCLFCFPLGMAILHWGRADRAPIETLPGMYLLQSPSSGCRGHLVRQPSAQPLLHPKLPLLVPPSTVSSAGRSQPGTRVDFHCLKRGPARG